MTADQVIELRKLWGKFNFADVLPSAIVLAEHDWLAYVQAMTAMVPRGEKIAWPSEDDVNWSWPEGILVVFSEPLHLGHNIISRGMPDGSIQVVDPPRQEEQVLAGLAVGKLRMLPTMAPDGQTLGDLAAYPVLWIGTDPHDTVTGHWTPGGKAMALGPDGVSESSRFLLSLIAALGHRLTKITVPSFNGRGEKRRTTRELPSLRVLQLSSGATVSKTEEHGSVEWSHRWMVRGHWRLQPCGPQRKLRRMTWIDPYVKGPEDKPLDVRPTVWRTGDKVPEGRL